MLLYTTLPLGDIIECLIRQGILLPLGIMLHVAVPQCTFYGAWPYDRFVRLSITCYLVTYYRSHNVKNKLQKFVDNL